MFRRTVTTAVVLILLSSLARGANEGPIADMQKVIASNSRLSDERKAVLENIVAEVLGSQPEMDNDKRLHAAKHLRQYLDDKIPATGSPTPAQFKLLADTFRWELGNYATLPPVTDQQREEIRKSILALSPGIRPAIDAIYLDTPEPVRAELAKRVEARVAALATSGRVGNYFYPLYLYPPKQAVHPEKVREEWSKNPAMISKGGAFTGNVEAQQDTPGPTYSREARASMFLDREGMFLQLQMDMVIAHFSGLAGAVQLGQVTVPPRELIEEARTTNAERMAQLERDTEQSKRKCQELEAETQRLLERSRKLLAETESARKARANRSATSQVCGANTQPCPQTQPAAP